jgi:phosphatidylglycerophosphate synthase
MTVAARIVGESQVRLWGLTAAERLRRQLRSAGVEIAPAADRVLLIRADYLFETRTISSLLAQPGTVLRCTRDGGRAAALVASADADTVSAALFDASSPLPPQMREISPAELASFDVKLRRAEPPLLEPVTESHRATLENQLYGNAYKGITDLVTKWMWPKPAKRIVRWCAARGVTPNAVTAASFVLTCAAAWLFVHGHFASGLAAGWIMTLLDTVDGKLARVTVQSSRFGHYFDHGIDLLHPPFWYLCWGEAIAEFDLLGVLAEAEIYALIVAGYVGGRVIEGAFHLFAECSVFSWRPFDAWFRLITARRNPCLILLTAALVAGRPDWGLFAVALWTGLTTLVLLVRLLQAGVLRAMRGQRLRSWMSEPDAAARHALSYRTFSSTLGAYAPG